MVNWIKKAGRDGKRYQVSFTLEVYNAPGSHEQQMRYFEINAADYIEEHLMRLTKDWVRFYGVNVNVEDLKVSEPSDFKLESSEHGPLPTKDEIADNTMPDPDDAEDSDPSDLRFYVLDTDSEIDTNNPIENEFVSGWSDSSMQLYLLLGSVKPWILAGSGSQADYKGLKVGATINVCDDGNGSTKFGRGRGRDIVVKAIAQGAEEIKKFPTGVYQLRVMK